MANKCRIITRSAASLKQPCHRLAQTLIHPWLHLKESTGNPNCAPLSDFARGMSTNTKSGWPPIVSTKGGSEKESAGHAHGDKWRKDFQEKQAERGKKFAQVKAAPSIKDEDWWTPDPMTGVYVPEYYHGCVTTAPRETNRKSSGLSASYERNETDQDQNQGPWFDNMEELPDMERHKKK